MRLGDRLRSVNGDEADADLMEPAAIEFDSVRIGNTLDPFIDLKMRARERLYRRLGNRITDSSLGERELRDLLELELADAIDAEEAPLTVHERERLASEITRDVIGYGPIQPYLDDPSITEVMVLSDKAIYVERGGMLIETGDRYVTEEHLRSVIERIVSNVGRRIDESSPTVDARLPDGSRVNAVIPPLAVDGPQLTIRKFSRKALLIEDLVALGTLNDGMAQLIGMGVEGRLNILVSGGTGTGKTTLLNAMSAFIPETDRIVTIEDAVELKLNQTHVVRLEARPPNIEGKGQVTIRDLVRNSLRMRPDRIVVGEVRGGEALDMLQAMNTGHEGSMSTLHANTPRDALARIETMVLMAGFDLPVRAIREQISSALDVIVHLSRLRDGSRRVTKVVEVDGMEGETITLSDLFSFDYEAGRDAGGRYLGQLEPTGLRPRFSEHLAEQGIELPDGLFGDPADGLQLRRQRR
ncbi:MAG: CpaF family protein [Acidimicrobiia bacterium]|nr:CpaF family protein [Acidimicrobiia bacterium]